MSGAGPFRLRALLEGVPDVDRAGLPAGALDVEVAEVRDDSRLVQPGDLFVAVPGTKIDARQFVPDVAARGARVLVIEGPPPTSFPGVVVRVGSARRALGVIAANRFGGAGALDLIAVTGTNGKTTTTYLLESMLLAAGRSPGVIGTVNVRAAAWPGGAREANWTTPARAGAAVGDRRDARRRHHRRRPRGHVAGAGSGTPRRLPVPRRRADQHHPGPPRRSRHDGALLRRQGDPVRAPDARPRRASASSSPTRKRGGACARGCAARAR